MVGKLHNTPHTVMERTRLFPFYSVDGLAAALKPGVALEKSALREAGAESASAAKGKKSPSLKRQKLESDFEKAKRLSIENDNELKIILEQLSLTGMEGTVAKDLHDDSLSCLRYAVKHHATFMCRNTDTPSDAVDASLEEMIQKMDSNYHRIDKSLLFSCDNLLVLERSHVIDRA